MLKLGSSLKSASSSPSCLQCFSWWSSRGSRWWALTNLISLTLFTSAWWFAKLPRRCSGTSCKIKRHIWRLRYTTQGECVSLRWMECQLRFTLKKKMTTTKSLREWRLMNSMLCYQRWLLNGLKTMSLGRFQKRCWMTRDSRKWTHLIWCKTQVLSTTVNQCWRCSLWPCYSSFWLQDQQVILKRESRMLKPSLQLCFVNIFCHTALESSELGKSNITVTWM